MSVEVLVKIRKAEEEARAAVEEARAKAQRIVSDARAEAERIVEEARFRAEAEARAYLDRAAELAGTEASETMRRAEEERKALLSIPPERFKKAVDLIVERVVKGHGGR